jgi:hypothetical protein
MRTEAKFKPPFSSVRSGAKCIPARASKVAGRCTPQSNIAGGQGGVLSAVLRRITSRYNTTKT